MLKILVRIASSRWTKLMLIVLWLSSLLFVLFDGWALKSHQALESGVLVERYRYFDIAPTPVFVWLTMILIGYVAHLFRHCSLGYYGLLEILCGLAGGFIAIGKLPLDHIPAWFGLFVSAFIIVRGAGNVAQAIAEEEGQPEGIRRCSKRPMY